MLFSESLDNPENLGSISREKVIDDCIDEGFFDESECISDMFGTDF